MRPVLAHEPYSLVLAVTAGGGRCADRPQVTTATPSLPGISSRTKPEDGAACDVAPRGIQRVASSVNY